MSCGYTDLLRDYEDDTEVSRYHAIEMIHWG